MPREEYQGFGEKHSAGAWARLLNVPRNTIWVNLKAGVTVEEFCSKKGIEYNRTQSKQKHKRLALTETLMKLLLEASGYDIRPLEVKAIKNKMRHQIIWGGRVLGLYDYNTDVLHLSGGESVKLIEPAIINPTIVYDGLLWWLGPSTKKKALKEAGI